MSFRSSVFSMLLLFGFITTGNLHAEPLPETNSPDTPQPTLTLTQAVILGFVEGATEYLPVSSTGHLLLVQHLMGMSGDERQKEAADSLAICIQLGAILAVLVLYFARIRQIVTGILGRDKDGLKLFINLIVAFLPAAVFGLLFRKAIKQYLFHPQPVAIALFVGGILILQQSWGRKKSEVETGKELAEISLPEAMFIGFMQCLALWPGFSRSLATILGCRWVKMRMSAAVEFSFLLGLVTLSAATTYEGLKHGKEMIAHYGTSMLLVSLVTAFVAAVVSVRFMIGALGKFGLAPFGYYRILLAIACFWWLSQ